MMRNTSAAEVQRSDIEFQHFEVWPAVRPFVQGAVTQEHLIDSESMSVC